MPSPPKSSLGRFARMAALAVALGGLVFLYAYLRETLALGSLVARFTELAQTPYGLPALFAVSTLAVVVNFPQILVVVAAATVFSPPAAMIATWAGSNVGALAAFAIGRYFLRDTLGRRLHASFLRPAVERAEREGTAVVFALRLAIFMAAPTHWLLGATRIPTRDFVLGTALGIAPWVAALVFLGHSVRDINRIKDLLSWELGAAMAGFAVLFMVARWVRARYLVDGGADAGPADPV